MPGYEALRHATELADALRRIHDGGRAHGALTPESVHLTATGLQLLPPELDAAAALTAYTAPEQIHGHEPDTSTDIFSFGAVVYEMFTGRPAFAGDTAEALAASICGSTPTPIGQGGLDQLLFTCLSKDRAGRWQCMRPVVTKLKLLGTSARLVENAAAPWYSRMEDSFHAEIERLEGCWSSRLEQHEKAVAALLQAADEDLSQKQAARLQALSEELNATSARLGDMDSRLAAAQQLAERLAEESRNDIAILRATVVSQLVRPRRQRRPSFWPLFRAGDQQNGKPG
jgi:eukaryotic-like serine/threonine-protein kinase